MKLSVLNERMGKFFTQKLVFGHGNPKAKIMLVGEAPGKEEEKYGRPFVGRSGKLLDKALDKAGIDREKIYITNVVKARPPANRKPKRKEVAAFLPFLLEEIKILRPKIICLLGSTATEALLGRYPVTKHRGKILKKGSKKFLITFHPAAVLRNMNRNRDFQKDIRKLKRFTL